MSSSMTRSVANVSIVVGVSELIAATVSVIIGIIAVTSYSGHPSASAGLWALVVSTQHVILMFGVFDETHTCQWKK